MPIFGQVWLWSSLAFLLGAVLCWLLVARPARNRVGELEAQLATRARRQAPPERPEQSRRRDDEAEFSRSVVPGVGERGRGEDSEYLTRSYGLRDTPPPLPPERDRLARYTDPDSGFDPIPEPVGQTQTFAPQTEQRPYGAFDDGVSAPPETDTELADQRPAVATQYLDISAGSLSAPPEVPTMSQPPSDRGWFDDELEGDAAEQAPEDQPAVPRNRHHMIAPFVDDEDEDGIGHALDGDERDERPAIEDDDGGTVFTQRTHPIPGELIRQIDEAGQEERAKADDGFVDDLADDPAEPEFDRRERTVESEPVEPAHALKEPVEQSHGFDEPDHGFDEPSRRFDEPAHAPAEPRHEFAEPAHALDERERTFDEPEPAFAESAHAFDEPEPEPERRPEPVAPPEQPVEQTEVVTAVRESTNDLPRRVPKSSKIVAAGVAVRVEPTPNALPKRVPGKPRHQIPFGVQPSASAEPAAPAAVADEPVESSRSLFEPIVPAADEGTATPPPPHRLRQASGGGRGPFGPGSAMPLPGGASPSPEFTIKASVAALRYCTPESPQFGRTVAEVWFRTAADAERVGFRPVG
jgi:hypothetical protein